MFHETVARKRVFFCFQRRVAIWAQARLLFSTKGLHWLKLASKSVSHEEDLYQWHLWGQRVPVSPAAWSEISRFTAVALLTENRAFPLYCYSVALCSR